MVDMTIVDQVGLQCNWFIFTNGNIRFVDTISPERIQPANTALLKLILKNSSFSSKFKWDIVKNIITDYIQIHIE